VVSDPSFVGSGWAFPVHTDPTGNIALTSGAPKIDESIRLILSTSPGERPMRPEFGCAIHRFVFESPDASTIGRISYEVRLALRRWEPRIDVQDVTVAPHPDEPNTLLVGIQYRIKETNDPRNLVFPFYSIPDEERRGAGRRAGGSAER
jgi:phage baseplate assembly protein W